MESPLIRVGNRNSSGCWRANEAARRRVSLSRSAWTQIELLARFSNGEVHEASEAAQIRNFLRFVPTTVTQVTLSVFDPDVRAEVDSEESIVRLQSDDAF